MTASTTTDRPAPRSALSPDVDSYGVTPVRLMLNTALQDLENLRHEPDHTKRLEHLQECRAAVQLAERDLEDLEQGLYSMLKEVK